MANLSKQQVAEILKNAPQGTTPQGIVAGLRKRGHILEGYPITENTEEKMPKEKGLIGRIKDAFTKRTDAASAAQDKSIAGEQTLASGALQTIGQGAGLVGDVGFETVKALVPDKFENQISQNVSEGKGLVGKILKSKTVQGTAEGYEQWKTNHPEAAANLESVVNIASLFPVGKGAQVAVKSAEVGAGTALKATGSAIAGAGRASKGVGEIAVQSAITPTVREAERIVTYRAKTPFLERVKNTLTGKAERPLTRAQTAIEQGVSGTESSIGVQARRLNEKLWTDEIAPAVKASPAKVTKDDLFRPILDRINKTAEPGRKKALTEAFEAIQDDYKGITELSLEDAQNIKRGLDEFTPDKIWRGKSVANEYQTLKADMANAIRNKTYDALTDVNIRKKYLDWANLKELEKVGVKAISEGGKKGGFGSFTMSLWDQATVPVKTLGGQVLYRVGNTFEFIGEKGIKKFGQFLSSKGFKKN